MALINTKGLEPFADLIKEIYGDLAKPGVQNVGTALGAILGLGITLMWPIMWANERAKIALENNLEKYRERLENIPPEQITSVAPEVAMPILEKLSYVTNEDLRNLYIELLAKASIKNLNNLAHPSFINVINNLSPDEGILLKAFSEVELMPSAIDQYRSIPFIEPRVENDLGHWQPFLKFLLKLPKHEPLVFSENFDAYLSNFSGLGIISIERQSYLTGVNAYDELIEALEYAKMPHIESLKERGMNITSQKGVIQITQYGELLLKALFEK